MRSLIISFLLFFPLLAPAQVLPTLLLVEHDSRKAALSCPGVASDQELDGFRAAGGVGLWMSSGRASGIFDAKAEGAFLKAFESSLEVIEVVDGSYDVTNGAGVVTGRFRPEETAASLGIAYKATDYLKFGLKACYVSSSLGYGASASTACGDLYSMYSVKNIKAALEFCNIGGALDYGAGPNRLPSLVRTSVSCNFLDCILLAADVDYLFCGSLMAGTGVEYVIKDIVSLRAGYHYGHSAAVIPSYVSAGIGVVFGKVSVDVVSFFGSDSLKGTTMFTARYSF